MKLHTLKKSDGYNKKKRALGRGNASGKGNYSARGLKGQGARSGSTSPAWFEGGQTPLYQRLPKAKGFKRHPKLVQDITPVNVSRLEQSTKIADGATITHDFLIEIGMVSKNAPVKILAKGTLSKKLHFVGIENFSETARKAVEAAGGSIK